MIGDTGRRDTRKDKNIYFPFSYTSTILAQYGTCKQKNQERIVLLGSATWLVGVKEIDLWPRAQATAAN